MKIPRRLFASVGYQGIKFSGDVRLFPMPKLSPSMKSGQIIKWHVKPGQILSEHDLVVDIKANSVEEVTDVEVPEMEVEIIEYMFVAKFLAKEKEILKAGAPIAIMCEKEQDIPLAANLKLNKESDVYDYISGPGIPMAMWQAYGKKPQSV